MSTKFLLTPSEQQRQLLFCPRCLCALRTPSLIAPPAEPISVYAFCARCAGALRQTSPAHQRRACEAIGARFNQQEVAK
jgi:hypothetical protein